MAIPGTGASLKIHNASLVLTDVSTYLDGIDGSSNADELDGTTFQPNVTNPIKNIVPGMRVRGFSLSGKWTAAAETMFAGIEGMQNLNYEYGPEGTTTGKTKISGTLNCLSYTGPQSSVAGITTFAVELRVNTRTLGTY